MKERLHRLITDPKHWRARAHEMRSVAAQLTDPKIKATTSGAADAYENLAQMCDAKMVGIGTRRQVEDTRLCERVKVQHDDRQ
jgi:hypothetical protein